MQTNNKTSNDMQGTLAKSAWHRPNISRIDIKRTLNGSGTYTDGVDFQLLPPT